MARALILVHVDDPSRAHRIPGTVTPALRDRGYEVELANFVTGELPPPVAEVDVLVVMGSAHAADDDGLEEVVVTAQFREQNLQSTPLSITATLTLRPMLAPCSSARCQSCGRSANVDPSAARIWNTATPTPSSPDGST